MRTLNDLSVKELEKVLEKNNKLKEQVFNDMFDNAHTWNMEYLDSWKNKGIDYAMGYDRGAYFHCTDEELFLDGLKKAQHDYGFLADEYNEVIEYAEKLMNRMENLDCDSKHYDANYERLADRLTELINELEYECYKRFMSEYESCFDNDYKKDYFVDFYMNARMDVEDFYIDDDYVLYEHIEYEKSYN